MSSAKSCDLHVKLKVIRGGHAFGSGWNEFPDR